MKRSVWYLALVFLVAAVFSACGSSKTVQASRPPEVGTNFNPLPAAKLGKAFRLPQPVETGVQTGAVLVDENGDPILCTANSQCEGYIYSDDCFWGAVCHNDFCEALIYDSCCESSGQDVICPGLVACGSDEDCADDNECTADYCNFFVLDGRCNNYAAYIGDWTCGSGACQNSVPKCSDGESVPESVCEPLEPSPEVCDYEDNDCDGATDEDYSLVGTPCDGGDSDFCENGTYTCLADGSDVECVNEEPEGWPGYEEICNSWDDDCDGETDEADAWGCSDYYYDGDGDLFGAASDPQCLCAPAAPWSATQDSDCNDADEDINPDINEACNGYDDDCDNLVDEELGTETCGIGPCEHTIDICQNGEIVECDPFEGAVAELCDYEDNDCDGAVDEDFFWLGWWCDSDDSDFCPYGWYTCTPDGSDTECVNEFIMDIVETCNSADDDCDSAVDEDFPLVGSSCDGNDSDFCENGTYTCTVDGSDVECVNEDLTNIAETCDYEDNDCDGAVDEGFVLGEECSVGTGACQSWDWTVCTEDELDVECPAVAGQPGVELCGNGLDDDCNGETDEGFPLLGLPCDGDDTDFCENGAYVCTADGLDVECGPEDPADITETCNSVDDDCDGLTDEDYILLDEACDSDDSDECAYGTYTCTADGSWVECVNEDPSDVAESCNNWDDDCDGQTDEDDACAPCNNAMELACGDLVGGSTTGGTSWIDSYSCKPTWPETGPEAAYYFTSPLGGVKATGTVSPDSFFDIFVELGECGSTCFAYGTKSKTVSAVAGETYFFLVDGYNGASGDYTLSLSCKEEACADGLDNDSDGLTDCEDAADCGACVSENCSNGSDDDSDGATDCADSQCLFDDNCAATCSAEASLVCDVPASGTTVGAGNDISGYSCFGGDQTGTDVVYHFTAEQSGTVVFGLSNLSTDLDLNVLVPCAANACLGHGNNWVTLDVAAGTTYYVVVDAVGGNAGTFTVMADCDW